MTQHNNPHGKSYTAKRGPWLLVYHELHATRSEAAVRERFLKSVGGSIEKKLLAGAPEQTV